MILFPQPDLVSVAGVRHNELALRHPRESTFWQRIARRFEFENVPDGPHRVSAVWVLRETYFSTTEMRARRQGRREYIYGHVQDRKSRGECRFNFKSCELASL